jgi:hypothetical protein
MKTRLLLLTICLLAAITPSATAAPHEGPMRFSVQSPCDGSGCEEYVYAEGVIEDDTAAKLKAFIEREKIHFRLIGFNSVGGSLYGGIQLGRLIRSLDMNTSIFDQPADECSWNQILDPTKHCPVPEAVCFSSCAYAFLGGVNRVMADYAMLGFHQFKSRNMLRVDEGRTQMIQAQIGVYTREMGVTSAVVDFASSIAPQQIGIIKQNEARRIGILTDSNLKEKWTTQVSDTGTFELTATESPDQDSQIKITLRMNERVLEMSVLYTYTGSRRSVAELRDAFKDQEDLELSVLHSQASPSESYQLQGRWTSFGTSGKSFLLSGPIPRKIVKALTLKPSFYLRAGSSMPNVYRDMKPSAIFGVDGLRQGLDAITKAYGEPEQGLKEDVEDAVHDLRLIRLEAQELTNVCNAITASPQLKHPNTDQCRTILAKAFDERKGLFYVTSIPGLELRASNNSVITIPYFYGPFSGEADAIDQQKLVRDEVRKAFEKFQKTMSNQ